MSIHNPYPAKITPAALTNRPSVRRRGRIREREAYARLENIGKVEARPQSGYYVRSRLAEPDAKLAKDEGGEEPVACCVSIEEGPLRIMRTLSDPSVVPLGGGIPNSDLLPVDKLNRMLATESRRFPIQSVSYTGPRGTQRLRTQIAKQSGGEDAPESGQGRSIRSGEGIRPGETTDDIFCPAHAAFPSFVASGTS